MNFSLPRVPDGKKRSASGFTRVDLFVLAGLLAVGVLLVAPARSSTRAKSKAAECLVNLGQIMRAMTLYTGDNAGLFPPNPDDGNMTAGHNWCAGQAGTGGSQEFYPELLADPTRSLLAPYLGSNTRLFRCTMDPRTGVYNGFDPTKRGTIIPAARSIAMNGAVGTLCAAADSGSGHSGKPLLSVNGVWLDNTHGHRRNSPWRTFGKTSEVIGPTPVNLWVITEEDPASINDASFAVGMSKAQWLDWPGTLHNFGCAIGFADGHTELHRWTDNRTRVVGGGISQLLVPGSKDWEWLSQRTSALAK